MRLDLDGVFFHVGLRRGLCLHTPSGPPCAHKPNVWLGGGGGQVGGGGGNEG